MNIDLRHHPLQISISKHAVEQYAERMCCSIAAAKVRLPKVLKQTRFSRNGEFGGRKVYRLGKWEFVLAIRPLRNVMEVDVISCWINTAGGDYLIARRDAAKPEKTFVDVKNAGFYLRLRDGRPRVLQGNDFLRKRYSDQRPMEKGRVRRKIRMYL